MVSFSPEIDISSHLVMVMMRVIILSIMIYLMRRSLMLSTRVAAIDAIWKLRHVNCDAGENIIQINIHTYTIFNMKIYIFKVIILKMLILISYLYQYL